MCRSTDQSGGRNRAAKAIDATHAAGNPLAEPTARQRSKTAEADITRIHGGRFTIDDTAGQSGDVTPPPPHRHDHAQQGPHVTRFDDPAGHVTNVVHGDMRAISAGIVTGGRMCIGNTAGHQGDVTPPARDAAPSPQQRSTTAPDRDTADHADQHDLHRWPPHRPNRTRHQRSLGQRSPRRLTALLTAGT